MHGYKHTLTLVKKKNNHGKVFILTLQYNYNKIVWFKHTNKVQKEIIDIPAIYETLQNYQPIKSVTQEPMGEFLFLFF